MQSQETATTWVTYADAVSSGLPALHLSTLARSRVKERQVLVDRDPSAGVNHLPELNERELVAKANEALTKMSTHLTQGPPDPRAVGAKKLRNGGVVYKFNTADMVQ